METRAGVCLCVGEVAKTGSSRVAIGSRKSPKPISANICYSTVPVSGQEIEGPYRAISL